jgi:hypothetical protein
LGRKLGGAPGDEMAFWSLIGSRSWLWDLSISRNIMENKHTVSVLRSGSVRFLSSKLGHHNCNRLPNIENCQKPYWTAKKTTKNPSKMVATVIKLI